MKEIQGFLLNVSFLSSTVVPYVGNNDGIPNPWGKRRGADGYRSEQKA